MAPRLLLVDDDPILAILVADWLSESGCEVVGPARTVKAALELVEKEGEALDGALLDVALDRGDLIPSPTLWRFSACPTPSSPATDWAASPPAIATSRF